MWFDGEVHEANTNEDPMDPDKTKRVSEYRAHYFTNLILALSFTYVYVRQSKMYGFTHFFFRWSFFRFEQAPSTGWNALSQVTGLCNRATFAGDQEHVRILDRWLANTYRLHYTQGLPHSAVARLSVVLLASLL